MTGIIPVESAGIGTNPNTALEASGTYRDIVDAFFPGESEFRKQLLWADFLQTSGLSSNPSDTDISTQVSFLTFLRNVATTPAPESGPFAALFDAYLGNAATTASKQSLWDQFLQQIGYSFNPAADDTQALDKFVSFLQTNYTNSNVALQSSPDEVVKRQVMLATLNLAIALLSTLQQTVGAQANNLIYYSKLNQQYIDMMSQVPLYTATAPATGWTVNTQDLSKWTLSYDGISMADVANYMASLQTSGAVDQQFVLTNHDIDNDTPTTDAGLTRPFIKITFSTGDPNNPAHDPPSITVALEAIQVNAGGAVPPGTEVVLGTPFTQDINISSLGANPTESEVSTLYQQAWLSLYNSPQTNSNNETLQQVINFNVNVTLTGDPAIANANQITVASVPNLTPFIQTPFQGSDTTSIQLRAEQNTQEQQYIANAQSQQDALKNTITNVQNNLSQSQTAISNQINQITSFIQDLTDLITAIFGR